MSVCVCDRERHRKKTYIFTHMFTLSMWGHKCKFYWSALLFCLWLRERASDVIKKHAPKKSFVNLPPSPLSHYCQLKRTIWWKKSEIKIKIFKFVLQRKKQRRERERKLLCYRFVFTLAHLLWAYFRILIKKQL